MTDEGSADMSLQLIQEYHHKVQEILPYGGSRNETAIRPAFQKLLETLIL